MIGKCRATASCFDDGLETRTSSRVAPGGAREAGLFAATYAFVAALYPADYPTLARAGTLTEKKAKV